MSETIKTTYSGVDIEYDEKRNRWRFELRGKERSSESLTLAKDAIDKPAPKEEKAFTPVKAIIHHYSSGYRECLVTSEAEVSYGRKSYWIKLDGKRSKESSLCAFSDENLLLIKEMKKLSDEASAIREKIEELSGRLMQFTL